jgi:3-oxoacyl-[acyl-carrier-protein] synthase-3
MLERGEQFPAMKGRDLFRAAVQRLPEVVREVCKAADVTLDDVDWFVAHQANDRINQSVKESLGLPDEKVPSNIARYGNTSSATIPILMDELLRSGRMRVGELVCLFALGAGLNWGAALLRL